MTKEKTLTFDDFKKFLFWLPRIESFTLDKGTPSPMSANDFLIYFKIMFYCALRVEEMSELKKSNFDLKEKILRIRTARTERIDETTIPPIILGELKKFLKNKKEDDYLFISKNTNKSLNRQVPIQYAQDACKLAGIDYLQITETRESKGISLLLFRESFEKFLHEKKLEKGLIDLKLRNKTYNRFGNYNINDLKNAEQSIFEVMLSDDEILEFSNWYEMEFKLYDKLSKKVREILREIIEDRKISVENIHARPKDPEEFHRKISKGIKYNPKEMQDLAGIRIICYVKSDVEKIKEAIKNTFKIVRKKETSYDDIENNSGYRHNQYVCKFTKNRIEHSEELRKFESRIFEIQVRTILQNAWDEIEHDDLYKNENNISNELRRRFFLVANVLESADNELDSLHNEITKS